MKIPGAHPQMVSNKLQINFQKNPCTYFLDHACTKPCPQMGYRERERLTDRLKPIYFRLGGGVKNTK